MPGGLPTIGGQQVCYPPQPSRPCPWHSNRTRIHKRRTPTVPLSGTNPLTPLRTMRHRPSNSGRPLPTLTQGADHAGSQPERSGCRTVTVQAMPRPLHGTRTARRVAPTMTPHPQGDHPRFVHHVAPPVRAKKGATGSNVLGTPVSDGCSVSLRLCAVRPSFSIGG
jgi:hypothetical protein